MVFWISKNAAKWKFNCKNRCRYNRKRIKVCQKLWQIASVYRAGSSRAVEAESVLGNFFSLHICPQRPSKKNIFSFSQLKRVVQLWKYSYLQATRFMNIDRNHRTCYHNKIDSWHVSLVAVASVVAQCTNRCTRRKGAVNALPTNTENPKMKKTRHHEKRATDKDEGNPHMRIE